MSLCVKKSISSKCGKIRYLLQCIYRRKYKKKEEKKKKKEEKKEKKEKKSTRRRKHRTCHFWRSRQIFTLEYSIHRNLKNAIGIKVCFSKYYQIELITSKLL